MKLFESVADLGGYLFRIIDNGGATVDRYTVAFSDGDCLAMSGNPTHPQGFSQWSEFDPLALQESVEEGRDIDLSWGCLPEHIRRHVLARLNEGYRDFLEAGERGDMHAVAPSRDEAKDNDGTHTSGGVGIYRDGDGYRVRKEGDDPEDDYGPFATFREALLCTLPDEYSLSGPEYQSAALDNNGTHTDTAHPDIMAAIAALEEKIAA